MNEDCLLIRTGVLSCGFGQKCDGLGFILPSFYWNGSSAVNLMLVHWQNSLGWTSLLLMYCSKAVWKHNGCNIYFGLKKAHWESFAARGTRHAAWWPMLCLRNKLHKLSFLLFQNQRPCSAQMFFAPLQIISSLLPGLHRASAVQVREWYSWRWQRFAVCLPWQFKR